MRRSQAGFTLIELVIVVVLLGIVGAAATARFQDLSASARQAALDGISAEIQSSSAINYAEGVLTAGTYAVAVTNTAPNNSCATIAAGLLTSGAVPSGWTVTGTVDDCGTAGNTDTDDCTLTNDDDGTVNTLFSVICTG